MYERFIKDVKETLYKTPGRTTPYFWATRGCSYRRREEWAQPALNLPRQRWRGGTSVHSKHFDVEAKCSPHWGRRRWRGNKRTKQAAEGGQKSCFEEMETRICSQPNGDSSNHPQDRKGTRHRKNCIDSRRREKSRRLEKGKVVRHIRGKDGVVRGLSLLHKGHHIDRPLNLVYPLKIRQAVTSDIRVSTAQSQLPERTRIRRQAAETAKEKIRQVIASEEDDWTLLVNGNKDGLKIELHSIFRGAWPEHDRKCRDTHLNRKWLF